MSSERGIAVSRVPDAPRGFVFGALTKPEALKRWLSGPSGWSLAVCKIDLEVGGAFRFLWHGADGAELGLRGIRPPRGRAAGWTGPAANCW